MRQLIETNRQLLGGAGRARDARAGPDLGFPSFKNGCLQPGIMEPLWALQPGHDLEFVPHSYLRRKNMSPPTPRPKERLLS